MDISPAARSEPATTRMRLALRCLAGLLFAQTLAGCGGGDASSAAATGPAPVTIPPPGAVQSVQSWQGHFIGTVEIGGGQFYGDALLTVDGAVRLYVGGPYDPTGAVQETSPDSSAQFVGNVAGQGSQASGNGFVIGHGCAARAAGRSCGATAPGEIKVSVRPGGIKGEIRVVTSSGDEIWSLDLAEWNTSWYALPAKGYKGGLYEEKVADFARDGDTIVSVDRIDRGGRLFFQSAHSGCIGNGALTPHLDGKFNVYDVDLVIQSCNTSYAYLNGEFEGLATTGPSSLWDYDDLLRTWLSKRDGAVWQTALSMLGTPR